MIGNFPGFFLKENFKKKYVFSWNDNSKTLKKIPIRIKNIPDSACLLSISLNHLPKLCCSVYGTVSPFTGGAYLTTEWQGTSVCIEANVKSSKKMFFGLASLFPPPTPLSLSTESVFFYFLKKDAEKDFKILPSEAENSLSLVIAKI